MTRPIYDIKLHILRGGIFVRDTEFSNLSEDAQALLFASSVRRTLKDREFVYLQDDQADYLYFIISGHIRLSCLMEDGSAVLYSILPPGESFGELGVMEASSYFDMATAVGLTVLRCVPIRTFHSQNGVAGQAELREALGRAVANRYRHFVSLMKTLSLKSLAARLAQALIRVAEELDMKTQYEGVAVPMVASFVTQSDLGLMARGSRGNINKLLKTWERAGYIRVQDRHILILSRERLEMIMLEEGA